MEQPFAQIVNLANEPLHIFFFDENFTFGSDVVAHQSLIFAEYLVLYSDGDNLIAHFVFVMTPNLYVIHFYNHPSGAY